MLNQVKIAQAGRAGEFYAAYFLEAAGVECHRVDKNAADLWCQLPSGLIVTVQVKSARKAMIPKRAASPIYRFHTLKGTTPADWYMFIALDLQLVLLTPTADVKNQSTTIKPREFTAEAQAADLAAFLSQG